MTTQSSTLGRGFDTSASSPYNLSSPSMSPGTSTPSSIKRKPLPHRPSSTPSGDDFSRFSGSVSYGNDARTTGERVSPAIELETLIKPADLFQDPQHLDQRNFVKWGVQWHKQPTFMMLFALAGLALALGHHFYYQSLNGTVAGSTERQQWAHNFGNVYAILVVAVLHRANGYAYQQYIWMIIRGRSFTLGTLDKMFSLTSDPMGFLSLELLRNASVAVWLALACWLMTLAGVLPPGTLTVSSGTANHSMDVLLPSFDWSSSGWTAGGGPLGPNYTLESINPAGTLQNNQELSTKPTALVLDLASQSAESMNVLQFSPPAPNCSYTLQVRGPYMQCETANSTQQPVFDFYVNALTNPSTPIVVTSSTLYDTSVQNVGESNVYMLYLSAFDPKLGEDGWTRWTPGDIGSADFQIGVDEFNNWPVALPADFENSTGYIVPGAPDNKTSWRMFPRQLWVQTANSSIVCTLGNATREVSFNFVDGVQNLAYGELQDFVPLFVPLFGIAPNEPLYNATPVNYDLYPYMAVYVALTNMLSGNVTTLLATSLATETSYRMTLTETSNRVLLTGLSACEDFADNIWSQHPVSYQRLNDYTSGVYEWNGTFSNDLFTNPSWMCRNGSLARAIEDLATNVTLSMLTSLNLTSNSTNATVQFFPTRNIYQYNSLPLFLSYGIALLFTGLSMALGFYAFHANGVIHSSEFSAIIATTRNEGLDGLSRGHSLGALPLDKEIMKTRLRFGQFDAGGGWERAGFGIGDTIRGLKKGGRYV